MVNFANNVKQVAFVDVLGLLIAFGVVLSSSAVEVNTNPSRYRKDLSSLKPGDTLNLAPGKYSRLTVNGLNGNPTAWISIKGPSSGPPAIVTGESGHNTVEIVNSSFVVIENLRINSVGIEDAFGISAQGGTANHTHHIRIEGNVLVGLSANQQTVGISTKTPTWGWIIRNNQISGAGTGIYLGNSDGSQPFVNGLIENNLIEDTIGYNMEIKDQISIPAVPGMPTGPTSTIIRNNVFIKDDQPSPDGDRPNVLVGAFPSTGIGSHNLYEIYANLFVHNHREALFQGSGRISLHDNIFVDGPPNYAAVVLRRHNFPLRVAYVYNNTVYTAGQGIHFGTTALEADAVVGNLVFGSAPISGTISRSSDNVAASLDNASSYVNSPSFELGAMDFYPRAGKCTGPAINLHRFDGDTAFDRDFNGFAKTAAKGAVVFRGAYAGEGTNPGWRLQSAIKPSTAESLAGHAQTTTVSQGLIESATGFAKRGLDSCAFVHRRRSNHVELGNTTRRTAWTTAAPCFAYVSRVCMDGCFRGRHNSNAASLLLRKPTARAQPSAAKRCNCASVARTSGSAVAFAGRSAAHVGGASAL